jgi:hypothetical protein
VKENEMEDVREVGEELHRLAEAEPLDPFDTAALLARGRKGRRRRKVLTTGGAVAGVAVVALTASLLSNLTTAGNKPPVSGGQTQGSSLFEPVPGVPSGEASVGQAMTMAEAERRCAQRFPDEKRSLQKPHEGPRSGQRMSYQIVIGAKRRMCTVPGGDKPSAALLAEVAKDPVPTSTAGQLRNCSVQTWVDVTGWRVTATARSSRLGTALLVAVSPSGRTAIACEITKGSLDGGMVSQGTYLMTLNDLRYDNNVITPATATKPAEQWTLNNIGGIGCSGTPCRTMYATVGWGRINGNATRVRLQMDAKTSTDVPVTDGWFAYNWVTPPTDADISQLSIAAYDRNGKVVKVLKR